MENSEQPGTSKAKAPRAASKSQASKGKSKAAKGGGGKAGGSKSAAASANPPKASKRGTSAKAVKTAAGKAKPKKPSTAATKRSSSTPPEPKAVAIAYMEAIGNHDLDGMAALWQPGGRGYIHGMTTLRAPDGLRVWFSRLFRAFPDLRLAVVGITAEGENVAVRWTLTGTFNGGFMFEGINPNGSRVEMEGIDLLTIHEGLIQEIHAYLNGAELARQLGALPPAGSSGEKTLLAAVNARTATKGLIGKIADRRSG